LAQPTTIDGDLRLAALDLPAAVASVIGAPAQPSGNKNGTVVTWPSEPFDGGVLGHLAGGLKVRVARVALTPKLAAQDVRAVLHFAPSTVSLGEIDGALAGGRVTGDLEFERGSNGMTLRSSIRVAGADAGELLPGEGQRALTGRLTLAADVEGSGRSPVALVGSLMGSGTFTLQDGRMARLDPSAFEGIVRKIDLGLPIDLTRIRDGMEAALAGGALAVPLAEGEIVVAVGQARVTNVAVHAGNTDLTVTGGIDLAQSMIDARLVLQGPVGLGGTSGNSRPEIDIVLKGPIATAKRTLNVAALTNWLSLRQIEQQTKRIESLESGRESPTKPVEPERQSAPAASPQPSTSDVMPVPAPAPKSSHGKPASAPPREVRTTSPPPAAAPPPAAPPARQQRPDPVAPSGFPSLRELFGLPPPIDIRPPSVPRG
jgi:large subunit ribosomal protein L24